MSVKCIWCDGINREKQNTIQVSKLPRSITTKRERERDEEEWKRRGRVHKTDKLSFPGQIYASQNTSFIPRAPEVIN